MAFFIMFIIIIVYIIQGKGESASPSQEESRASKDSSLSSNRTDESNPSSMTSKPERPCSLQVLEHKKKMSQLYFLNASKNACFYSLLLHKLFV